jgi:hypothetical protein
MSLEIRDPRFVDVAPATAYDRRWSVEANRLAEDALPAIRSTATKWGATVGTLTGIFGIVALIKGRENVDDLTRGWEITVGVLVACALLFAAVSVVLAALAAQGSVKKIDVTGEAVRRFYRREATTARWQLVFSRVTAVLAVLLLGTAVGMTWYGPQDAPATENPPTFLAVLEDGSATCGSLAVSSGPLVLETADGPRVVDATKLVSLTPVTACR